MVDRDATRLAQQLGSELAALRRDVETLKRNFRASQLTRSSIDDDNLEVRDDQQRTRSVIGKHVDGTFAVTYQNGPQPPTPSTPTLIAAELSLVVVWDGLMADGTAPPADVVRVDIHESETSGFTPDGTTIKSSLPTEGARLLVLDNQEHHVKLVAVTNADAASDPSTEVSKTPLPVSELAAGTIDGQTITGVDIYASNLFTSETGYRIGLEGTAGHDRLVAYNSNDVTTGELVIFVDNDFDVFRMNGEINTADGNRTGIVDTSSIGMIAEYADKVTPNQTRQSLLQTSANSASLVSWVSDAGTSQARNQVFANTTGITLSAIDASNLFLSRVTCNQDGTIETHGTLVGGMKLIAEFEFTSPASGVVFSSLSQGYDHMKILVRGNRINDANDFRSVFLRFNGDTGNNYAFSWTRQIVGGSDANGDVDPADGLECAAFGRSTSNCEITVFGYARTGIKTTQGTSWCQSGTASTGKAFVVGGGRWDTTDPVTGVEVSLFAGDFDVGNTIQIYGIGGAT